MKLMLEPAHRLRCDLETLLWTFHISDDLCLSKSLYQFNAVMAVCEGLDRWKKCVSG